MTSTGARVSAVTSRRRAVAASLFVGMVGGLAAVMWAWPSAVDPSRPQPSPPVTSAPTPRLVADPPVVSPAPAARPVVAPLPAAPKAPETPACLDAINMLDARVPPDIACAVLAQVGWSTEDIQCLNDRRAATPLPCAREVADTDTGYGP